MMRRDFFFLIRGFIPFLLYLFLTAGIIVGCAREVFGYVFFGDLLNCHLADVGFATVHCTVRGRLTAYDKHNNVQDA